MEKKRNTQKKRKRIIKEKSDKNTDNMVNFIFF